MSSKSSKLLQRAIKENRGWLVGRAPLADYTRDSLFACLEERTLQGLSVAAGSLAVLAIYYGRVGEIRVADGDISGWRELQKAVAYHLCSLKINSRVFANTAVWRSMGRGSDLTNDTRIAACLHCYHLMNEDKSKLPITLNVLQTMASVPGAVVEEYWKRRVFEPFVLLLHAKREPIDLPEDLVQRDLGPYAGVLECWDWPERVPAAIAEVCDYHCEKMFERRNDWGPEFIDAPFDLVPVEVLAIFAVRRCLGLPPVTVNHPLLETPLANVVPDPTFDIDDTLRYVENVYSDVFGGT